MADIINTGVAGRTYVRFSLPAEHAHLQTLVRAGGRMDHEFGLYWIPAHNHEVAIAIVVATGGDASGKKAHGITFYAPNGGIGLSCGWVFVSVNPGMDLVRYRNPCSQTPDELKEIPFAKMLDLAVSCPHPGLKGAMREMVILSDALANPKAAPRPQPTPRYLEIANVPAKAEKALLALGGKRTGGATWAVPERCAAKAAEIVGIWRKGPEKSATTDRIATDKQINAIEAMLRKLLKLDPMVADDYASEIEDEGGTAKLTLKQASAFIERIGVSIEEAKT